MGMFEIDGDVVEDDAPAIFLRRAYLAFHGLNKANFSDTLIFFATYVAAGACNRVEAKSNCRFAANADGSCNRWADNMTCGYTFGVQKWLQYLTLQLCYQIGTLVIAEHESGSLTSASLSSVAVASKFLSKDNSLSLLLARSGPSLQDAATNFTSCHLFVSQASSFLECCNLGFSVLYMTM
ncbi:hypothetical protein Tco_0718901, partial [Tanacetum coccineum]